MGELDKTCSQLGDCIMTPWDFLLFSSQIILRLVPNIADTTIQIINGMEVNDISIQGGFDYPDPLCCRENRSEILQMRKRSTDEENIYETSLSFVIKISIEGALSLGLVQLPGVCLGLLGVFRSFQR